MHARSAHTDPAVLVAALSRDQVKLDLPTYDLCCLAGLYLRADRQALASFEEEMLLDVFEQVCDVVEPGAENPRKRATHAIQRLREQRMLARVDGAGFVKAGEYALTRLAAAIVEYFLADDALTRESLTLLTRTLLGQIADIKGAATRAADPAAWLSDVVAPLRVTVGDLVAGIERRQRGLDAVQEQVQDDIAKLLQADWFGAVDEAQSLLDTTTVTLQELNVVLLRDTHQFVALLQEVHDLAEAADVTEGQEAAQRVMEQVDRIALWGEARQRAWSEYYQYVHRYLRDVVRLDPDRALSQRLRDQLATWTPCGFHLVVADEPSIRLLRDLSPRVERPAVARACLDRDTPPETVPPGDEVDLERLVRDALLGGPTTLGDVTGVVLARLAVDRRFGAAGRIAAVVASLTRPRVDREPPWVPVDDALEIEQWDLAKRGDVA